MIKANELRIGNWVDAGITGQLLFQIRAKDFHYTDFKGLKPIPLTPEILEKCGFGPNIPGYAWWDKREFLLGREGERFFYGTWGEFKNEPCVDEVRELKYVHQLQNIYYALTGEELTIQL